MASVFFWIAMALGVPMLVAGLGNILVDGVLEWLVGERWKKVPEVAIDFLEGTIASACAGGLSLWATGRVPMIVPSVLAAYASIWLVARGERIPEAIVEGEFVSHQWRKVCPPKTPPSTPAARRCDCPPTRDERCPRRPWRGLPCRLSGTWSARTRPCIAFQDPPERRTPRTTLASYVESGFSRNAIRKFGVHVVKQPSAAPALRRNLFPSVGATF